jgi:hypothetical protein
MRRKYSHRINPMRTGGPVNIIEAIARTPYVSAAFRATLSSAEQKACDARQAYLDRCATLGETADPVMAEETYQRALHRAQGTHRYCGE